jgi:phosphoglycerate kinase
MPDIRGKRVLVRSELNTPIENGVVSDAYRVEMALPTLKWLAERGAKVIVTAHLGRNPEDSLAPVYEVLRTMLPNSQFAPDVVGEEARKAIDTLPEGGVLLLENLRSNKGEKENSLEFSQALASLADYYVDDAFGNAHREDASMVGVPALMPGFAGLLLERELVELEKVLNPTHPSLFILGGAKFETKEPLLEAILPRYDYIFIGGALANDFLKSGGFQVGRSLVSEGTEHVAKLMASGKLVLPVDVVVENEQGQVLTKKVGNIDEQDKIVDIGPESITELGMRIAHADCILWNGPLGLYEGGYTKSTEEIAQLIADAKGHSVIGGGDTVALIRESKLESSFGFLSTGGGAMLDYLVDGVLPAVEALKQSPENK